MPAWSLAIGALAVAGGVAGVVRLGRHPAAATVPTPPTAAAAGTPPLALHVTNARRITFGDACEEFPSFSPDGSAVYYDGTVGRDSFIYRVEPTSGAAPRQLTHVRGWDIAASVSPGGERIAFVRIEGERVAAYVGPVDGHEPPHLVVKGGVRPSWTADGTAIWAGAGHPLAAYDATTGAMKASIADGPPVKKALTVERADGSLVAAFPSHGSSDSTVGGLALMQPTGATRWLLQEPILEALAVTADGRHALASRITPTGAELMDVPLDGSPPTSLAATGIEAREGLALSRDGTQVVWSSCAEVGQLVAIDGRGSFRAIRPDVTGPTSLAAVPSRPEIAVVSTRTGKAAPWIVPLSGGAPRAIPIGDAVASEIAVSQDGKRFVVSEPGRGLAIGSLEGDAPILELTHVPTDSTPAFRRGDAEVVFTRHRKDGTPQIMTISVDGGEARELMGAGSDGAASSPVDERIAYFAGNSDDDYVPTIWDGRAGVIRPLSPKLIAGRYGYLRFSPDGRRIALVRGQTELIEVDVASGAIVRSFSTPTDDQLGAPAYVPGGMVAVRVRWQGNVWMGDVAK